MEGGIRLLPGPLMLRPSLGRATLLAVVLLIVSSECGAAVGAAGDRSSPVTVTGDYHGGTVSTVIKAAPSPGSANPQGSVVSTSRSPACSWTQVFVSQALPLPGRMRGQRGTWWQRWCTSSGYSGQPVFVPNRSGQAVRLSLTPGQLAERAVNQLQLPAPSVGESPRGQALVGLPEWFWVTRSQWAPLRQRTAARGVWAAVTARPVSTVWQPGDGAPALVCAGPGTAYRPGVPASGQSTDCSHTYVTSSAGQPQAGGNPNDRSFTVTVTTRWSVSWVGSGGIRGRLPTMTRSTSFRLPVAQRQTVVTGGSA
jgi:hypothetical protein